MNTPDKESSYRVVTSEEQILTWSRCHRAEDTSRVLPPPPLPRLSAGGGNNPKLEKKGAATFGCAFWKSGSRGAPFPGGASGEVFVNGKNPSFSLLSSPPATHTQPRDGASKGLSCCHHGTSGVREGNHVRTHIQNFWTETHF